VNCQQLFEPPPRRCNGWSTSRLGAGRFVSLTHDWAIERQAPRPPWAAMVERDGRAAGFAHVTWGRGRHRSGVATALVAPTSGATAHDPRPR
jgi:hypothetical protein